MIKFFSHIEEFDGKTNQIKVKDEKGITYVVPLAFDGNMIRIDKNTPVIVIMSDQAMSDIDFDTEQRIRIDAVAIPIYNKERLNPDEITNTRKQIGKIANGKIESYVETGKSIHIHSGHVGNQTLTVTGNQTIVEDAKFMNPDFSYGDFAAPENFLLRFRPDFPYILPELLPNADIFKKAAKLGKALVKLMRS